MLRLYSLRCVFVCVSLSLFSYTLYIKQSNEILPLFPFFCSPFSSILLLPFSLSSVSFISFSCSSSSTLFSFFLSSDLSHYIHTKSTFWKWIHLILLINDTLCDGRDFRRPLFLREKQLYSSWPNSNSSGGWSEVFTQEFIPKWRIGVVI